MKQVRESLGFELGKRIDERVPFTIKYRVKADIYWTLKDRLYWEMEAPLWDAVRWGDKL